MTGEQTFLLSDWSKSMTSRTHLRRGYKQETKSSKCLVHCVNTMLTLFGVEKTPYGRFWMGKSLSGLTFMNDILDAPAGVFAFPVDTRAQSCRASVSRCLYVRIFNKIKYCYLIIY